MSGELERWTGSPSDLQRLRRILDDLDARTKISRGLVRVNGAMEQRIRAPLKFDPAGASWIEFEPPFDVGARVSLKHGPSLRVRQDALEVTPAEGVSELDAGATLAEVIDGFNKLVVSLRTSGVLNT